MTDSLNSQSDSDFLRAEERRPGLPLGLSDPHTDCASRSLSRFSSSGLTRSLPASIPHNTTSPDNAWSIDFDRDRDQIPDRQRNDPTSGVVNLTVREPSALQKPNVALPADSGRRPIAKTASNKDYYTGDRRDLLRERAPIESSNPRSVVPKRSAVH